MPQTILIPTDFSIESVQVLRGYLHQNTTEEKLNIVVASGYDTGGSITGLLFFSRNRVQKKMCLESFQNALYIIKNKYSSIIETINIEFFSGWNQSAFQSFLNDHHVDRIVYTNDLSLQSNCKEWFDITPFIQRCTLPQTHIPVQVSNDVHKEFNALSQLFSKLSEL